MEKDKLKLVYVLKNGYDYRNYGMFEFIFSSDPSKIDAKALGWEEMPASATAEPPDEDNVDLILSLKTNKIDFHCLHESNDRSYMDGYYTIHCLAHENTTSNNSDPIYEETPLLVFHYGMTVKEVKDHFLTRDIVLKESTLDKAEVKEKKVILTEDDEDVDNNEMNF